MTGGMMNKKQNVKAFTLLEVLIATILVGIAISALMAANGSFTRINSAGLELSTAEFLLEQIRGRSTLTAFGSLGGLAATHSPPIDAAGNVLNEFSNYSQVVQVDRVLASNLDQVDGTNASPFIRVHVSVLYNGAEVTEASWIRADYDS